MSVLQVVPKELILHLLESADDSKDLVSLVSTSHLFYDVWITSRRSISRVVLGRQILCYREAHQLFLAQTADSHEGYCDPIMEAKHLCCNAARVSAACDLFTQENIARFRGPSSSQLLPRERLRFTRAFYRIWTAVARHRGQDPVRMSLLHLFPGTDKKTAAMATATVPDREMQCIFELAAWMLLVSSPAFKAALVPGLFCENWAPVLARTWRLGFSRVRTPAERPVGFVGGEEGGDGFFATFAESWEGLYGLALGVLRLYPPDTVPDIGGRRPERLRFY